MLVDIEIAIACDKLLFIAELFEPRQLVKGIGQDVTAKCGLAAAVERQ
jgi:hypothetical protein